MSVENPTPSEIRLFLERQMLSQLDRSGAVAQTHSLNDHVLIARLDLQQLVSFKSGAEQPLDVNLSPRQIMEVTRIRRQLLDQVCRFTKTKIGRNLPAAIETEKGLLADSANDPSFKVAQIAGGEVRLLADKKNYARHLMSKLSDHPLMFDGNRDRPRSLDNEEDLLAIALSLDAPAYEMLRTMEALDREPALSLPAAGPLGWD